MSAGTFPYRQVYPVYDCDIELLGRSQPAHQHSSRRCWNPDAENCPGFAMRTPILLKCINWGCAFPFRAIVWLQDRAFFVHGIWVKADCLSRHRRTPAAAYAFSGTHPASLSYVCIGRDKCCVRGPCYVCPPGFLGRVQWIHCGLISRPPAESILRYQPRQTLASVFFLFLYFYFFKSSAFVLLRYKDSMHL